MNIEEILKKDPKDLTPEELAFLTEHQDELTDEEEAKFFPPPSGDEKVTVNKSVIDRKDIAVKKQRARAETEKTRGDA